MITKYDHEQWGQGHALYTTDGENGIPVLVSAVDEKTGQLVIVSPLVRVTYDGSRMFKTPPRNVIRLLPDEYYTLAGMQPGDSFPEPVDLDDYPLRKLSTVRHAAPVFDFNDEETPYTS